MLSLQRIIKQVTSYLYAVLRWVLFQTLSLTSCIMVTTAGHKNTCRDDITVFPDSKVHGANMGTTWDLSAPGGPHVGPMNLAIWVVALMPAHSETEIQMNIIRPGPSVTITFHDSILCNQWVLCNKYGTGRGKCSAVSFIIVANEMSEYVRKNIVRHTAHTIVSCPKP